MRETELKTYIALKITYDSNLALIAKIRAAKRPMRGISLKSRQLFQELMDSLYYDTMGIRNQLDLLKTPYIDQVEKDSVEAEARAQRNKAIIMQKRRAAFVETGPKPNCGSCDDTGINNRGHLCCKCQTGRDKIDTERAELGLVTWKDEPPVKKRKKKC